MTLDPRRLAAARGPCRPAEPGFSQSLGRSAAARRPRDPARRSPPKTASPPAKKVPSDQQRLAGAHRSLVRRLGPRLTHREDSRTCRITSPATFTCETTDPIATGASSAWLDRLTPDDSLVIVGDLCDFWMGCAPAHDDPLQMREPAGPGRVPPPGRLAGDHGRQSRRVALPVLPGRAGRDDHRRASRS